jgi:predicted amidohydrolase
MSRVIRLGLVQCHSELGTETFDPRDDNLALALKHMKESADAGVDLIVFGELFLTGYRTDEWLHRWATVVDPPDRHVQALVDEARRLNLHVILGLATRGRVMPGDIYNSSLLIGPRGVIGIYRKIHVAGFPYSQGISLERLFYSPGNELPVFETALGRIGLHICYDLTYPEVVRTLVLKGAELVINSSATVCGMETYVQHAMYTRAVENATWLAICSVVGDQRGDELVGGSRVLDPTGRVVGIAGENVDAVVIADIDLDLAHEVRSKMHSFSIRQPELYRPVVEPVPYP